MATVRATPDQKPFKLIDVFDNRDEIVKFTDLENFFNVYQDKNAYYFFNLNSTIYLDIPPERLKTFTCQHDMHWSIISYKLYDTVRLAWLLMKVNNITPDMVFSIVPAGAEIKYLDRSDVTTVIDALTNKDVE